MSWWIARYVIMSTVYGLVSTLLTVMVLRLSGKSGVGRFFAVIFLVATFFFLTQSPFPSPGAMNCPVTTAGPQLRLFEFVGTGRILYARDATLREWLSNTYIASTVMNFVFCIAIGTALARHVGRFMYAVLFGLGLSLFVEFTQLTGVWGIFPCAYRQFDVDDILLNVLGCAIGFAVARLLSRRHGV